MIYMIILKEDMNLDMWPYLQAGKQVPFIFA